MTEARPLDFDSDFGALGMFNVEISASNKLNFFNLFGAQEGNFDLFLPSSAFTQKRKLIN